MGAAALGAVRKHLASDAAVYIFWDARHSAPERARELGDELAGQLRGGGLRVDGVLVWPPRGEHGFGYDPVFQPIGHDVTFGEMDPAEKHAMSHRAEAFAKLVAAVF